MSAAKLCSPTMPKMSPDRSSVRGGGFTVAAQRHM